MSERHREPFQSSPLINVFSIPGRCPGLELANAFGINTGQQSDVGESSMSLPILRRGYSELGDQTLEIFMIGTSKDDPSSGLFRQIL